MIINHKAQSLVKHGLNYVTLPPQIIQSIQDPIALAIWCYLQSQNQGWIIRRNDIMKKYGLGRIRYDKAVKELRSLGLVWDEYRREKGKIVDRFMVCSNVPRIEEKALRSENLQDGDLEASSSLSVGKPTINEKQQVGKSDHLINNQSINKLSNTYTNNNIAIEIGFCLELNIFKDISDSTAIPEDFLIMDSWPTFLGKYLSSEMTEKEVVGKFMSWATRHWSEFGGEMAYHKKRTAQKVRR